MEQCAVCVAQKANAAADKISAVVVIAAGANELMILGAMFTPPNC